MLNQAIIIAARAHEGQLDKGGHPYILHPLRVMLQCQTEAERICAVLHDVVEDTNITLEYLREQGFTDEILTALACLTKRDGESYDDFISRVLQNELASRVKLADLRDNMDLSRIQTPSNEDEARMRKYQRAVDRIEATLHY